MKKEKIFVKLVLVIIVILGIGVHYYFKDKTISKYSNIEQLKYNNETTSNRYWGKGIENNGVETCLYKNKETVYR